MKHLIINLIILWIGIGIWYGNRKITKKIKNTEPTYSDYLYRLHLILNKSEYDIFKIAALEVNNHSYDEHFSDYVKTGSLPMYLINFLEAGKPHIEKCRVKTWVW